MYSFIQKWYNEKCNGYITLISVLLVSAISVSIAISVVLLGLSSSRTGFSFQESAEARALANACSEEALMQIRASTPFTGSGNLALGNGTCSYTVATGGSENRTVTATGTVRSTIRKVKIILTQINPSITISSWQEVADF